jgi:hypothetical protein
VLDTTEARQHVVAYAGGLVREMAEVDQATLEHEIGSGQLGMNMLPATLRSASLYFRGREIATVPVTVAVSLGLHDTGKNREDIQRYLAQGVWEPETRRFVRREHAAHGGARIREYAGEQRALRELGKAGLLSSSNAREVDMITPERLLLYEPAQFVALHHHSEIPDDYTERPPDEALLWGLTHLAKYCDVLHALWFDRSSRRNYQKGRDGLMPARPPEVVLDIVHKECGYNNPVIMGIEIDMESALRKYLGLLQWREDELSMA